MDGGTTPTTFNNYKKPPQKLKTRQMQNFGQLQGHNCKFETTLWIFYFFMFEKHTPFLFPSFKFLLSACFKLSLRISKALNPNGHINDIKMQDIIGSVRRSLVFRSTSGDDGGGFSGFVEKIGSSIRKSRIGFFPRPPVPAFPSLKKDEAPAIRWRKGELIGCGAFGRVYMGMNLDSGELLAVKQVN